MKKLLMGAFVLGMGAAGVAHAGQKWPVFPDGNVVVNTASRYAYGWISGARNSPNGNERLSCMVYGSSGGWRSANCYFADGKNNVAVCSSSNPEVINAIQFAQSDSYVAVNWDANGNCTQVSMYQDSAYIPKAP